MTKSQPNRPYSDGEWQRLTSACTGVITSAYSVHQQLAAAELGAAPAVHGASRDNLAWSLARTGALAVGELLDRLASAGVQADRAEILAVHRAMFPSAQVALSYNILLAKRTGIVPDGIDALTVADITRISGHSVLLAYRKGRTGGEALTCPATRCDCWTAG